MGQFSVGANTIVFPKELTEKDRALLARGLVQAMGEGAGVEAYFETPGFRLRQFDSNGTSMAERIRVGLKERGIVRDGGNRIALEARMS